MEEEVHSSRREWLWGIVALIAVLVGGLYIAYNANSLSGAVYASSMNDDGSIALIAYSLDTREIEEIGVTVGDGMAPLAVIPSPDSEKQLIVAYDRDSGRKVLLSDVSGFRTVIVDGEVPDAPSWAGDSQTVAFSVLRDAETVDPANPDSWNVIRAVLNGDALEIGHGYQPFPSYDGRTYALTSRGIELFSRADEESELIIASAVPVTVSTPLAVSRDGKRVAWVNPADRSLQVFEYSEGFYAPLQFLKDVEFDALTFSPDGEYVLGSKSLGATTVLAAVSVRSGRVITVGTLPGILSLASWHQDEE